MTRSVAATATTLMAIAFAWKRFILFINILKAILYFSSYSHAAMVRTVVGAAAEEEVMVGRAMGAVRPATDRAVVFPIDLRSLDCPSAVHGRI